MSDDGRDGVAVVIVGGEVVGFDDGIGGGGGGDSELGQVVVEVQVGGHGFDVCGKNAEENKKITKREVRETAFVGVYIDRVGGLKNFTESFQSVR